MPSIVGRGVTVQVAKTIVAAANPVTAVTKAKPPVASSTGHGMVAKDIGFIEGVEGMVNLEGQAFRVLTAPTADTLTMQSLDTSTFPDFTGQAVIQRVTEWATLAKATSYSIGGGTAEKLDDTGLIDDIKQELAGLLDAQTMTIGNNMETFNSEAMQIVEDAAVNQAYVVIRVILKDGSVRVARGQPSLPGEDVQRGQIGTGQFSLSVKGRIIKAPA